MAYERNTTEGIRSWLSAEINSPGWNSVSIAKGLTEDVMSIIVQDFNEFDSRIKQGVLLSTMCMRKGDLMALGDGLNKILQVALNDSDDFVRTSAHVLQSYPNKQIFDLNLETWSDSFKSLLQSIGSAIQKNGFNFHPPEDMILQPNARVTPMYASNTYSSYKPTHTQHFTLSSNQKDIISSKARHARFKELVEMEERSEQAEAQAAQVVAQKRAGAELINSKAKRVASPTNSVQNPFPFPPHHRNSVPVSPGGIMPNAMAAGRPIPPRSFSLGSAPNAPASGSSSLFTKRPARPTRPSPSGGGGGLFIKQNKPAGVQRPTQRTTTGGTLSGSNLPRGLQRVQKTQMLDFSAASEIEQNTANAVKKAQDDIKAKAEAKKQEALEKKKKAADEKREREEAKRQQKAMAAAAAKEAKEAAAAAKKLAQEEQAAQESLPKSPASAPTSPKTPTSPFSPKIKHEHVFAIPALPAHHTQQQQQRLSPKTSPKTPPTEKLTTF